jgi:hypothetical protein
MEQPRTSPFRLLLGPPLIAMGLAAVVAYSLSDDSPPKPIAPAQPEPVPVSPPVAIAPKPVERAQVRPPEPPPSAPPPAAPAPPGETPTAEVVPDPARAMIERFKDPAAREHAQLMVIESAKMTLKTRDLAQLQKLRDTLRVEGIEQVIPANDLAAIDVGIACLAQGAEAKQRAFEFIEDNPSSAMNEGLRSACQ